jgi:hypothetical protein
MSKTSTKKKALKRTHKPNSTGTIQTHSRQAATAAAAAKAEKRHTLCNNTSSGRPGKKTRKKLSRQQAAELRDTLNAEFRDLRNGVSAAKPSTIHNLPLPLPPLYIFKFLLCGDHIAFPILVSIVWYCPASVI